MCLLPIELVPPRKKRLTPKAVVLVLILLAAFAFVPMLRSALRSGVGIAAGAVYVLAYLFAVVMLPLMFFALARFAYSVFLAALSARVAHQSHPQCALYERRIRRSQHGDHRDRITSRRAS